MINAIDAESWKVRIERVMFMDSIRIYMYRYRNGRTEILRPDGLIQSFSEGMAPLTNEVQPVLVLNGFDAKTILVALAEAISEEGIRTPDSHRLQATLDTQKVHLEDLRKLLKLNK